MIRKWVKILPYFIVEKIAEGGRSVKSDENFIHTKYGYCYYTLPLNAPAIVFNLYVEPEYRRQGHARKLLQSAINEIRATGYKGKIEVEATPRDNSISHRELTAFYESMSLRVLRANEPKNNKSYSLKEVLW